MKTIRPFVLVSLLFSFVLAGCDDGGFSISAHNDYGDTAEQEQTINVPSESTGQGSHGSGGSESDTPKEPGEGTDETLHPGTSADPVEPVNIGNQIINFRLGFVKITEDDFALVTCSENPFEEKYNFAYYTIDNQELDNSKTVLKETVEEQDTYKLYLGSKESKTYTVQFYDKDGKQYGRSEITVNNPVIHYSFFNNVINIVEIKFISIGMGFINQFNKVRDFFRRIFGGRMI